MDQGVDELEKSMSLPLDIKSEYWRRFSARVLRMGCCVFVLLLLIAAFAPVREVAISEGQLVTEQPAIAVGHLEGGIVAEIFAEQGQVLEVGQSIARLSPRRAESDLEQVRTRRAFLVLQIERISAQLAGRPPNFGEAGESHPDIAANQAALHHAECEVYDAEIRAIDAEIRERALERDASAREVASILSRISIAQQQVDMQRSLRESGYATQTALLDAETKLENERAELATSEKSEISALRGIADAEARRSNLKAKRIEEWSVRLAELSAEEEELAQRLQGHADQVERLLIVSPIRGLVQEVTIRGSGEILSPGDRVATIVPVGERLLAEVKVLPNDIGHIEAGMTAEVTVTTFDKEVYGALSGVVASISPTTFESPQEELFYIVRLNIDRNTLSDGKAEYDLLPGMVVRAEILTGERSILRYLLKPLVRAFDRAFIER